MAMASHGQPSRKHPSGPLLMHFLQPMQSMGSTAIRPNGVQSSSGTPNRQSSTGQYSQHAGDRAQPVRHSVMTANSFGFFLRGVARPLDFGSNFSSSGTIPTALVAPGWAGIAVIIPRTVQFAACLFKRFKPLAALLRALCDKLSLPTAGIPRDSVELPPAFWYIASTGPSKY